MSPWAVFAALLLAFHVYDLRHVRRLWRNEGSSFDELRPGSLPRGRRAQRAWRRQQPLITVTFIPFLVALLVLSFTDDTGSGWLRDLIDG